MFIISSSKGGYNLLIGEAVSALNRFQSFLFTYALWSKTLSQVVTLLHYKRNSKNVKK